MSFRQQKAVTQTTTSNCDFANDKKTCILVGIASKATTRKVRRDAYRRKEARTMSKNDSKTKENQKAKAKEKVSEVEEQTEKAAKNAEKDVAQTVSDKAKQVSDAAKKAVDNVSTQPVQDKVDAGVAQAKKTVSNIGSGIKTGLQNHGIDTAKLGDALKGDAKKAATATIAGAKFVSEKANSLLGNLAERFADSPKTVTPVEHELEHDLDEIEKDEGDAAGEKQ